MVLVLLPAWSISALTTGCASTSPLRADEEQREMLDLLLPRRVEIVEPFTRVRSFDENASPDGVELLLRAVNALDNPGLMIVGKIRVELHEYIGASADNKGGLLERWEIDLSTSKNQMSYWNRLTQMYEFRLGIEPTRIAPARKYVLSVTYNSPLGEHLADDCVLEYRGSTSALTGSLERRPG